TGGLVFGFTVVGAPPPQAVSAASPVASRMARSIFMNLSLAATAVRRGLGKHIFHAITLTAEDAHHTIHLGAVRAIHRWPEAHGLEDLLDLAARELLAVRKLLAHGLGAVAAAGQAAVPAEHGVGALPPVVGPAIVRRHVTRLEVVGIDQVFRLHLALGVFDAAGGVVE